MEDYHAQERLIDPDPRFNWPLYRTNIVRIIGSRMEAIQPHEDNEEALQYEK